MDRQPSWKKHQSKSRFKSIITIFIVVTAFFVVANGVVKGFSIKKSISESRWDSKSSFTVAIDSINPSVFIYQPSKSNLVVLALDGETVYETGSFDEPIKKLALAVDGDGLQLTSALSNTFGAKVENFIKLKDDKVITEEIAEESFADFASISTPFKILFGGYENNILATNITRIDAFKLWWQVKGLSVDSLKFTDVSNYQQEIIIDRDNQVLGADTASLQRFMSEYMDNIEVVREGKTVRIINKSGFAGSARLAALFVESVGGTVIEVVNEKGSQDETEISAGDDNSYSAEYLANIFDCDITEAKKGLETGDITIVVGADFAARYFE